MNLTVADPVQKFRLAPALALGYQMVCVPLRLWNHPVAEWADHGEGLQCRHGSSTVCCGGTVAHGALNVAVCGGVLDVDVLLPWPRAAVRRVLSRDLACAGATT